MLRCDVQLGLSCSECPFGVATSWWYIRVTVCLCCACGVMALFCSFCWLGGLMGLRTGVWVCAGSGVLVDASRILGNCQACLVCQDNGCCCLAKAAADGEHHAAATGSWCPPSLAVCLCWYHPDACTAALGHYRLHGLNGFSGITRHTLCHYDLLYCKHSVTDW